MTKKKSTDPKEFVVVIKPNKESTYKNTVDALDEMTINDVKRYALVDISEVENQLITVQKRDQVDNISDYFYGITVELNLIKKLYHGRK